MSTNEENLQCFDIAELDATDPVLACAVRRMESVRNDGEHPGGTAICAEAATEESVALLYIDLPDATDQDVVGLLKGTWFLADEVESAERVQYLVFHAGRCGLRVATGDFVGALQDATYYGALDIAIRAADKVWLGRFGEEFAERLDREWICLPRPARAPRVDPDLYSEDVVKMYEETERYWTPRGYAHCDKCQVTGLASKGACECPSPQREDSSVWDDRTFRSMHHIFASMGVAEEDEEVLQAFNDDLMDYARSLEDEHYGTNGQA